MQRNQGLGAHQGSSSERKTNVTEKMRFEGLTLTVESVERALEFYSGKLGLEVEGNAVPGSR